MVEYKYAGTPLDDCIKHLIEKMKVEPPKREANTMSFIEIVFNHLIIKALERAKENKLTESGEVAAFIVGYLSSVVHLNDIVISERKKDEN